MSKEKQIEEMARSLNEATFGVNVHTLADYLHPETINKVAEYLYNAGYRKQSEWISVEERLPEPYTDVLTYDTVDFFEANYLTKDEVWAKGVLVTHWMPLPEAPKGGAE